MREIKEEDFEAVAKFEIEISEISFGEKAITDLEFHCKKLAKAKDRRGMIVIEDTESGKIVGWVWMEKKQNSLTGEVYANFKSIYADECIRELYFNLFADRIGPAADIADSIKGELSFRGKVGKNIEERKDKKDKSYTMFSAFSTEKVDENFEYQWVRFFCFDRQREEWLQPGVKVEAKGEMTVSVHNGKPDISCRVEELAQYIPESDNFNQ